MSPEADPHASERPSHRVRVWDLPTRLFHWLLVFFVVGLVLTGKSGGNALHWHARFGYAVLTLLAFRFAWGFVGGRWSRFTSFVYRPAHVMDYLSGRARPEHLVGHNPLGAGSVFAMLLVLLAQAATGLFADDEAGFVGPLNALLSTDRGLALTSYHRNVGQWLIFALVALHVAAIVYYVLRKRQPLVRTMIVGDKELPWLAKSARDDAASRSLAAVLLAGCAGLVWWVVRMGSAG